MLSLRLGDYFLTIPESLRQGGSLLPLRRDGISPDSSLISSGTGPPWRSSRPERTAAPAEQPGDASSGFQFTTRSSPEAGRQGRRFYPLRQGFFPRHAAPRSPSSPSLPSDIPPRKRKHDSPCRFPPSADVCTVKERESGNGTARRRTPVPRQGRGAGGRQPFTDCQQEAKITDGMCGKNLPGTRRRCRSFCAETEP